MPKKSKDRCKSLINDNHKFISRIAKTLYYGKKSSTSGLSLPVIEIASDLFSDTYKENSLGKLYFDDAAAVSRHVGVTPCSLVLALLYIDRLKVVNPKYLEKNTPSELFLVSLVVSSKFLHDDGEENEVYMDEWAIAGGISNKELIQLEKDFLKAIALTMHGTDTGRTDLYKHDLLFCDTSAGKHTSWGCCVNWDVYVNHLLFWKKFEELEMSVARKEGLHRGWFTYTELSTFLKYNELFNLVQRVASFSVILVVTYTAGVLVVFGSMWFVSHIPGNCLQNRSLFSNIQQTYTNTNVEIDYHFDHIKNSDDAFLEDKNVIQENDFKCNDNISSEYDYENINNCKNTKINEVEFWNWCIIFIKERFSETCKLTGYLDLILGSNLLFDNRFYVSFVATKKIDLKEQINKAIKQFLNEQMESLWIKEWSAMNKKGLYKQEKISGCIQEVMS